MTTLDNEFPTDNDIFQTFHRMALDGYPLGNAVAVIAMRHKMAIGDIEGALSRELKRRGVEFQKYLDNREVLK